MCDQVILTTIWLYNVKNFLTHHERRVEDEWNINGTVMTVQ